MPLITKEILHQGSTKNTDSIWNETISHLYWVGYYQKCEGVKIWNEGKLLYMDWFCKLEHYKNSEVEFLDNLKISFSGYNQRIEIVVLQRVLLYLFIIDRKIQTSQISTTTPLQNEKPLFLYKHQQIPLFMTI